ncbi:MAG: glycosyltransferase family 4 protein [Candidatus Omnitrophica bacterium]|nr:glycosyltransferase family 4 protein [Candidatus Omnitrophota bacterium]MDD5487618.1 glycosyltransferase family 4 protein [Candidatus Omnitrophota bacterium]
MNVMIITTHMNMGGVGVYITDLSRYLHRYGHKVTVVSGGGELEGKLAEYGVKHHTADILTKQEFSLKVWKAVGAIGELAREEDTQVIHAQTRVTQIISEVVSRRTGIPFVSTCHGFFKHKRISRMLLPAWGNRVIAISNSVKGHLIRDFGVPENKISMVYNGIELARFSGISGRKDATMLREMGLPQDTFVVGTIGRLSPVKGYKYLVEAFSALAAEEPRARMVMVGDGPEKKSLEKQITSLGLAGKVSMVPGGQPPEEYLPMFDIFCSPSMHEGLGLSLMEAMAAERACVASDVGGLSELITDGRDGLLAPPGDVAALAKRLMELAKDDILRKDLAKAARRKAFDNYDIHTSVEKTIEVYQEVL